MLDKITLSSAAVHAWHKVANRIAETAAVARPSPPSAGDNINAALPDLSDPATVGLLEHQALKLYGGEQFSVRSTTGLKMSGAKTFWWRVKNLTGSSIASGSVVLEGTEHAKIACLIDALEQYEENRNE